MPNRSLRAVMCRIRAPKLTEPLELENAGWMASILKALHKSDNRLYFQKQEVSKGEDYHVFLLGEYLATLKLRKEDKPVLTLVSRQYEIKASFGLIEKKIKVANPEDSSEFDWEVTHYEIQNNGLAYLNTFLNHCISAMQESTKGGFFRGPPPNYRRY